MDCHATVSLFVAVVAVVFVVLIRLIQFVKVMVRHFCLYPHCCWTPAVHPAQPLLSLPSFSVQTVLLLSVDLQDNAVDKRHVLLKIC